MRKVRRTSSHTAAILIAMFMDWGKTRMRISKRTLKLIGRRKRLQEGFERNVREWLEEFGLVLIELDEGKGYCVVKMTALSGVAPFSFKKFRSRTEGDLDLDDEDTLWEIVADWAGEESDP